MAFVFKNQIFIWKTSVFFKMWFKSWFKPQFNPLLKYYSFVALGSSLCTYVLELTASVHTVAKLSIDFSAVGNTLPIFKNSISNNVRCKHRPLSEMRQQF